MKLLSLITLFFLISPIQAETIDLPQVDNSNKKNQNLKIKEKPVVHFIVQNIATKTIRVYEKASCANCFHKMVLEAPMVVGEDAYGYRSVLGAFKILSWHKFYQDHKKLYPSWYDPVFNDLPKPHAPVSEWMMKRGAFGWYTAKLYPHAFAQWLHGTRGWGADKQKYILPFADKKETITWESSGCTRVDNETIAFLHHLVKKGSYVFKIYAPEEILDKNLSRYEDSQNKWNYILTATDIRKTNPQSIDQQEVYTQGLDSSFYLEEGTYQYSIKPSKKKVHNPYKVKIQNLKGVFYPDIGKFEDYQQPKSLVSSGLSFPKFMIFKRPK